MRRAGCSSDLCLEIFREMQKAGIGVRAGSAPEPEEVEEPKDDASKKDGEEDETLTSQG